MPKYDLVVRYTDGITYGINWNMLPGKNIYDLNSLMHIDNFTSEYNDRHELMEVFKTFGLVKERQAKKWFKIEYKNSKLTKEAQIIYKNDLKFMNIEYLTKYILLKYNDVKFLQFLVEVFGDNPIQSKNIEIFKTYINKYIYEFYSKYNFDDKQDLTNNINALRDFICRQIYKYDNRTKSYLYYEDGTPMFNYKQYRDFAKIISNYSKNNDTKEEMDLFEKTHFENQDINNSLKTLIKRK